MKEVNNITHSDDIDKSYGILESTQNSDQRKIKIAKRFLHKKGKTIYAEVSSTLLTSNEGNTVFSLPI